MTRYARWWIVVAGYAAALVAAAAVVWWRQLHTLGLDAQASAGMNAFGDALLGLFVFTLVAFVPTALALFLLRPVPAFWRVASVASMVVAGTGLTAGWIMGSMSARSAAHTPGTMATVVALRMFAVPMLLGCDALLAVFAPARGPRWRFIVASAMEGATAAIALMR